MSEFRELLQAQCAELAPKLGDCPDCHGLGELHTVLGVDRAENDLIFSVTLCGHCDGTGWLRTVYGSLRPCACCNRVFQSSLVVAGRYTRYCQHCLGARRRSHLVAGATFALPPRNAGSYVAGETRPGAANGGTSANDSGGAGLVSLIQE
jgi:hypothetical protein